MQFADVACALKTQTAIIGNIIVRGCPDCKMQSTKYGKRLQEPRVSGILYEVKHERGERYARFDVPKQGCCCFRSILHFILILEALPLLRGGAFFSGEGFLKEENHAAKHRLFQGHL